MWPSVRCCDGEHAAVRRRRLPDPVLDCVHSIDIVREPREFQKNGAGRCAPQADLYPPIGVVVENAVDIDLPRLAAALDVAPVQLPNERVAGHRDADPRETAKNLHGPGFHDSGCGMLVQHMASRAGSRKRHAARRRFLRGLKKSSEKLSIQARSMFSGGVSRARIPPTSKNGTAPEDCRVVFRCGRIYIFLDGCAGVSQTIASDETSDERRPPRNA